MEHARPSARDLPTVRLIERATTQPGDRGDIQGPKAFASNPLADLVPEATADARPTILGQDVNHIDLEFCADVPLSRRTRAHKRDHASLYLDDEVNTVPVLSVFAQPARPVCFFHV